MNQKHLVQDVQEDKWKKGKKDICFQIGPTYEKITCLRHIFIINVCLNRLR